MLRNADIAFFRFWDGESGMCALELGYAAGHSVYVALPREVLPAFDDELTASLLRCAASRGDGTVVPWPLRALQEPKSSRRGVEVRAVRVLDVALFEAPDGESIAIQFTHPDRRETWAHFTTACAQLLVGQVRDRIAR